MHTSSRPRRLLTALAGLSLSAALVGALVVSPAAAGTAAAGPTTLVTERDAAAAATLKPAPAQATEDEPAYYSKRSTVAPWAGRLCHGRAPISRAVVCEFGKTAKPSATIALVGDSKMGQYAPAFIQMANARNWRVLIITKSACAFSDAQVERVGKPYPECAAWNRSAMKAIERHRPDLVVTNQTASAGRLPGDELPTSAAMEQGLVSRWTTLKRMGVPVVVMLDNPGSPHGDVYTCVAKNLKKPSRCDFTAVSAAASVQKRAAERVGGVGVVDMRPTLCPGGVCKAVVGQYLVYRQGSHLTNTYVKKLKPTITTKFDAARKVATTK